MTPLPLSAAAHRLSLASCWILVACFGLIVLDLATEQPGRWHLIPRAAEPIVTWAPLVVAAVALGLVAAAAILREPDALRMRTWFGCSAVAFLYGSAAAWQHYLPSYVY
jgi:hypothetical protein